MSKIDLTEASSFKYEVERT